MIDFCLVVEYNNGDEEWECGLWEDNGGFGFFFVDVLFVECVVKVCGEWEVCVVWDCVECVVCGCVYGDF